MNTEKRLKKSRLICCLSARLGIALPELKSRLAGKKAILKKRFGTDAEIMISVRREDDPFSDIGGDRRIEILDAFLQVSYPETFLLQDLIRAVDGMGGDLGDVIDVEKSSLSVGTAIVILPFAGDVFLGFLGRRRPDMTAREMSDYWLNIHAPLALKLMGPPHSDHGYDQLHVDQHLSRKASQRAGFPYVEYDMGDSINVPDLGRFLAAMADPDIAQQLYEDEKRFLDTTSWRGAFTDKV
jgi:EthD domain